MSDPEAKQHSDVMRTDKEDSGTDRRDGVDEAEESNPVREKAERMGWVPENDWTGNPDDWVPEDIFVVKAPLEQKVNGMNKAIEGRDKNIAALSGQVKELMDLMSKNEIKNLSQQRKAALEDDDLEKVDDFNDQITEVKAKSKRVEQQQMTPTESLTVSNFKQRNPWYENDNELRTFADSFASSIASQRGGLDDNGLIEVEKAVVRAFPEKFKNSNRGNASNVESGKQQRRTPQAKHTTRDLDDDTYRVMRTLVKDGAVKSEQDYIKQLEDIGYFGD
jgi:hypothetical protein